jgi:hypothetical protein
MATPVREGLLRAACCSWWAIPANYQVSAFSIGDARDVVEQLEGATWGSGPRRPSVVKPLVFWDGGHHQVVYVVPGDLIDLLVVEVIHWWSAALVVGLLRSITYTSTEPFCISRPKR